MFLPVSYSSFSYPNSIQTFYLLNTFYCCISILPFSFPLSIIFISDFPYTDIVTNSSTSSISQPHFPDVQLSPPFNFSNPNYSNKTSTPVPTAMFSPSITPPVSSSVRRISPIRPRITLRPLYSLLRETEKSDTSYISPSLPRKVKSLEPVTPIRLAIPGQGPKHPRASDMPFRSLPSIINPPITSTILAPSLPISTVRPSCRYPPPDSQPLLPTPSLSSTDSGPFSWETPSGLNTWTHIVSFKLPLSSLLCLSFHRRPYIFLYILDSYC